MVAAAATDSRVVVRFDGGRRRSGAFPSRWPSASAKISSCTLHPRGNRASVVSDSLVGNG
eukprot:6182358-Pleurochrysis_carterae.AAC.2